MHTIRRMKQVIKRTSMSCHVYGPLKRMHRRLFDDVGRRLFRENVTFYGQFVGPGDLCFDVGSNIGTKTEALLALGARVVAFEPQPSSFDEMKARCSPNRRLTAVQAALGAEPGELPMYLAKWSPMSSLVADWAADNRLDVIQVPVTTLDLAIDRYGLPQFCKIDVEGFEREVLQGLSHAVPWISIEYNLTDAGVQRALDCVDNLSRFGGLWMNVSFGDEAKLHWRDWIPYERFRDHFPSMAPRQHAARSPGWIDFGDILINIRSPRDGG